MNPQYEILKNGTRFAYTRPPFGEDDDLICEIIVRWLKSSKLCVVGKIVQMCSANPNDMDVLDAIEFVDDVDQISFFIFHPSVLTILPNKDEWSFKPMENDKN